MRVVEVFPNTFVAQLAARALEAAGIPAVVSADDAGGYYPMLQESVGVRVLVPEAALLEAKAILAELELDHENESES